ncbi:MAG: ABC transporter ATP-binding protein [Proteobacteria bacterium]|nr:MAG: ABC transporter ATP-binding protein [Pseudomonadota bacterium]
MSQTGLRRFSKLFVLELWPWYLGGALCLAVTNIISLEIPQLAKALVNHLHEGVKASAVDASRLEYLALAIIGLGLAQIFVRSSSRILIFWPGRKLEASSKSYIFRRVMRLPQIFFDRYGMGDLISRFANDIGQLRIFFAFGVLQILNLIFISVFTLYQMLQVHRLLTLSSLVPIIIMLVITRIIMPRMQAFTRKNQEAVGLLTNRVTETFTNIHVIQTNASERSFQKLIAEENEKVYATDMKVLLLRTLFFPLMTALTGLSQLIVLFYGGILVTSGKISIGDILAFNIYLSYLAFPLTSIGIIISVYQRSKTALERIDPFFTQTLESQEHAGGDRPLPTAVKPMQLLIQDLHFHYPSSEHQVFTGIRLELPKGEMLGVCGAVGSGKSTLFHLLTRLYNPPRGTIFFEGQDILDLDPQDLRESISYALQKVHLFSASIRDNLAFGMKRIPSDEELTQATRAAQVYNEIESFPEKWNTEIGEKGLRLSGGQKQRLALARLFLRKPQILLLDDVLSAVDNLTEARLIQEFRKLNCTMIINSHRSSVLELCDRVLYLKEGRIFDQGPFKDLILRHPELQEEIHEQATPETAL